MSKKAPRKKSIPKQDKNKNFRLTWIIAGIGIAALGGIMIFSNISAKSPDSANTIPVSGILTYQSNVKPILGQSCIGCHRSTGTKNNLPLTSYENVISMVKPKDANSSLLFQSVDGGKMAGRLSARDTEIIKTWINQGAPEK
jgi:hypothetical protein